MHLLKFLIFFSPSSPVNCFEKVWLKFESSFKWINKYVVIIIIIIMSEIFLS